MLALVFKEEMNKIINDVANHSKQQYLDTQITKPKPSHLKLSLLYLFLYSKSYTIDQLRPICSATGLIQLGLDIHEWVNNERMISPGKIEVRQLQVLAGDYFSSQYYRLLASFGDQNSIRMIAKSVRKINQQKVIYYQLKEKVNNNFDKWLSLHKEIQLGLFHGFLSEEDYTWKLIIERFIILDILQNGEWRKWNHRNLLRNFQDSIDLISDSLKKINNVEVIHELQKLLQHFESTSTPSLVAEEI